MIFRIIDFCCMFNHFSTIRVEVRAIPNPSIFTNINLNLQHLENIEIEKIKEDALCSKSYNLKFQYFFCFFDIGTV